jgi:hypothetical protein
VGDIAALGGGAAIGGTAGSDGGKAGNQNLQGGQAGAGSQDTPEQPTLGAPGSQIWFESSIALELTTVWFRDNWSGNAPESGHSCRRLERQAMSATELEAIADVTLIPLNVACTTDGFDYTELAVFDTDGTTRRYRDTGCDYLAVECNAGMLDPNNPVSRIFPGETGAECETPP